MSSAGVISGTSSPELPPERARQGEYDFVFDVDMGPSRGIGKLPYNKGQNPMAVACDRHLARCAPVRSGMQPALCVRVCIQSVNSFLPRRLQMCMEAFRHKCRVSRSACCVCNALLRFVVTMNGAMAVRKQQVLSRDMLPQMRNLGFREVALEPCHASAVDFWVRHWDMCMQ